jgi:hypothetical protein
MSGRKVFTAGEVLLAADVNDYLMDQTVMVYSSSSVRATAIPTPTEGMFTVTTDNDELDYYNGTSWVNALPIGAWTAYTPTFTGITIGDATLDFAYAQIGKTVFVRGSIVWGSTTSTVFSGMTFTPPINIGASQSAAANTIGTMQTGSFSGVVTVSSATAIIPSLINVSSTYASRTPIATSTPSAWSSGSRVMVNFSYESV